MYDKKLDEKLIDHEADAAQPVKPVTTAPQPAKRYQYMGDVVTTASGVTMAPGQIVELDEAHADTKRMLAQKLLAPYQVTGVRHA